MMKCPNCSKVLEDGSRFCDNCGQQIFPKIFCQCCGVQTSSEYDHCPNCGATLEKGTVIQPQTVKKKAVRTKAAFKFPKKLVAIGGACVAVVLIVALVFSLLFKSGNKESYLAYLKDKEIYYTGISKLNPWQVTTELIENVDVEQSELVQNAYIYAGYIQMSSDGKLLFYFDKLNEDSEGFSLFYRQANKPEKDPVKIDSDITHYSISESGKTVTYMKGEDGTLYQHNLTDKEKIGSDVSGYGVSADGKKLGWLNKDGDLYLKYAGKEKEKLESGINWVKYVNKDMDTIYYMKDDSLYRMVEGKEREKIATDVSKIINVYDSGEIYYTRSDSTEKYFIDYVEDDMKDSDAFMTEPEPPEYPLYRNYNTYEEYNTAITQYYTDYEVYKQEQTAYYEKQKRDELRKKLAEATMSQLTETLYYFDGKEEIMLSDAFVHREAAAEETPVIVFSLLEQEEIKKLKLSEIASINDVRDIVEEAGDSLYEKYIAVKDSITEIEQNEAFRLNISPDGKTVYFMDNVSEESYGELYRMKISKDKPQKPELYDSDVYAHYGYCLDNDTYRYYKDVRDGKGDLYINRERIDYDVKIYSDVCQEEAGIVVYLTDWNDEKEYGTLKIFKNGKAVKAADDVHYYSVTSTGEIFYLCNYNLKYYRGELFLYKNSKIKKIDDDVMAFIVVGDGGNENDVYYGW